VARLTGKRLVIFGCGYVGRAVAQWGLRDGAAVTGVTRNPETVRKLEAEGIPAVRAELSSADWHRDVPGGAEFVLYSAAGGGRGISGYQQSYIAGMRSVLDWARQDPVGTLVYTSSTSVYGQDDGEVVDETMPANADSPSAAILREAESLVAESSKGSVAARRWFILRLAGIYGPGRHHLLDQIRAGAPAPGRDPSHRLNLIHRDDIVGAIGAAFLAPESVRDEIFNVCDDDPVTRGEIVDWLMSRVGRTAAAARDGDGSGGSPRPVRNRTFSNKKLKSLLRWKPRYPGFRDGYRQILEG